MKKKIAILLMLISLVYMSCEDQELAPRRDISPSVNGLKDGPPVPTRFACGGYFSSNYYTINSYYIYPLQSVDISSAANGAQISVFLTAHDVPNRFTIIDANNISVAYSAWMGTANYPGSWGMSLAGASTSTLYFTKTAGCSPYKIRIETQTPPDYSYSPTTDFWSAQVSCP